MLLNSKRHIDRRGGEVNIIKLLFNNTPCLPKHKSTIRRFEQCYSVLSTIAQVLRKISLKILAF